MKLPQSLVLLFLGTALSAGCHQAEKRCDFNGCDPTCVSSGPIHYESPLPVVTPAQPAKPQTPPEEPKTLPPVTPPKKVPPADEFLPPVKGPLNDTNPPPADDAGPDPGFKPTNTPSA
ncbi:hypothetical protein SH661x_001279 [Planctomicrobium sp. SH661]|uniref:hypothetical protein n=1 Tax=Planctomicrobium sp. SH661 TaxID=3448124 RepID=UPI003F5C5962